MFDGFILLLHGAEMRFFDFDIFSDTVKWRRLRFFMH